MSSKSPIRVVVTGAAGQIGYSLLPLICNGEVFGHGQPVILHLLDIEVAQKRLAGVVMELEDCAYPLVHGIIATTDLKVAFEKVHYAFLVGGIPRQAGQERKQLLAANSPIFVGQGKALNDHADPNVKVVVVANPANTNCLVCMRNAPKVPKENFTAMTRLDHNRAKGQLAKKLGVTADAIKKIAIWGNHSKTMYPYVQQGYIGTDEKSSTRIVEKVDKDFMTKELIPTVQDRGAAIIAARGLSSALSAAYAAAQHVRDWHLGTEEWVSMAIPSDGSYGVAKDIIYSFPVTCSGGKYHIVQGLQLDEASLAALKVTEKELLDERADVDAIFAEANK